MLTLPLNNGYSIPQLGLGTGGIKPNETEAIIKTALEIGYRHFDCATLYGNQDEIGNAFQAVFSSGKVKREDVFITSKIWNTHHSYEKARKATDDILKSLKLDYLDLLLIHWPIGYLEGDDPFPKKDGKVLFSGVDYLETWRALEDAVKTKKVRSIGVSNFNTNQIERVLQNCTIQPQVNQVEMHVYLQQNALVEFCKKHNIVVTAYTPLANNTHFLKPGDSKLFQEKVLLDIAATHNKTAAQVALRWAIQRGTVVIPKSSSAVRLKENLNVFDFELTPDEMIVINGLDRNWRIINFPDDAADKNYPFTEV